MTPITIHKGGDKMETEVERLERIFKTVNDTLTTMRDIINLLSKQIKKINERIDLLEETQQHHWAESFNDHHHNP